MATLQDIVTEVNRRAIGRPIGELQNFRMINKGLTRRPTSSVFGKARDDDWIFHVGGREELQFNLGFENPFSEGDFRYGVAFSFETSRSMPTIDPLIPKAARFNDYLRENGDDFAGLWMWHFADNSRSELSRPMPISSELVRPHVFVFLGMLGSRAAPDYDAVLDTLDRLLPLYTFVESSEAEGEHILGEEEPPLRLGPPEGPNQTAATHAEKVLDVDLRHNALQKQLHSELAAEYGFEHVGREYPALGGGKIDMIVRTKAVRIFFEIKTASTARSCIREALGQLLDYACWPGGLPVDQVVIVGTPPATPVTQAYLDRLNQSFPIPLTYRSITLVDA